MVLATYHQATGKFALRQSVGGNLIISATGYAGKGPGRNNPDLEHVKNVGPIPAGYYTVNRPSLHPRLGPVAMRLVAHDDKMMHGRSGFLIHGDSADGDASEGCIILPRPIREIAARYTPFVLQVRP